MSHAPLTEYLRTLAPFVLKDLESKSELRRSGALHRLRRAKEEFRSQPDADAIAGARLGDALDVIAFEQGYRNWRELTDADPMASSDDETDGEAQWYSVEVSFYDAADTKPSFYGEEVVIVKASSEDEAEKKAVQKSNESTLADDRIDYVRRTRVLEVLAEAHAIEVGDTVSVREAGEFEGKGGIVLGINLDSAIVGLGDEHDNEFEVEFDLQDLELDEKARLCGACEGAADRWSPCTICKRGVSQAESLSGSSFVAPFEPHILGVGDRVHVIASYQIGSVASTNGSVVGVAFPGAEVRFYEAHQLSYVGGPLPVAGDSGGSGLPSGSEDGIAE